MDRHLRCPQCRARTLKVDEGPECLIAHCRNCDYHDVSHTEAA